MRDGKIEKRQIKDLQQFHFFFFLFFSFFFLSIILYSTKYSTPRVYMVDVLLFSGFFYRLASPSLLELFVDIIGFGLMLQWPFLFNISIKQAITLF